MKKVGIILVLCAFVLSGCVVHRGHHHGGHHRGKHKVKVVVPAKVVIKPRGARVLVY